MCQGPADPSHHHQHCGLPHQTLTTKSGSVSQSSPWASTFTDTSCPTAAFHICTRRTWHYPEPSLWTLLAHSHGNVRPQESWQSSAGKDPLHLPCWSQSLTQRKAPKTVTFEPQQLFHKTLGENHSRQAHWLHSSNAHRILMQISTSKVQFPALTSLLPPWCNAYLPEVGLLKFVCFPTFSSLPSVLEKVQRKAACALTVLVQCTVWCLCLLWGKNGLKS